MTDRSGIISLANQLWDCKNMDELKLPTEYNDDRQHTTPN
jgi:hypothetical protein